MWSKADFRAIPEIAENPQMPVCQGVRAIRLCLVGWMLIRSQMWRPTNWATPGYFAVVIIARKSCDAKIFLSVVNPVVKAVFLPGLQTGSNPANDRVARGSGPPFLRSWMVLTALPKQARYQLRYTRVIGISPAGRIAASGALMRRTGQHAYYIGHDEKKQGESMLCAQHKICWRRWTCRKKNAAGKTHARAG